MADKIETRLKELGLVLPSAPPPAANYVPFVRVGGLVFIAGQLPLENGNLRYTGLVGQDLTVDEAAAAARVCGVNVIAQIKAACGGVLDRLHQVVQLNVFVAAPSSFVDQPKVANGASDLMVEVFGDAGRHARVATGSSSLPRNAPVEVAAIVDITYTG